jgi:2-polyprenyl-3-methyl-5-hydroxy-6-metoxy-1,4-benzoquinol methylase
MDIDKAKKLVVTINDTLKKLQALNEEIVNVVINATKEAPKIEKETPPIIAATSTETFEAAKALLNSPQWPEAVDSKLIVDESSEEDKMNRAAGIIEFIVEQDLKDIKFLDYGCGEGHIAIKARELGASMAVGYDVKSSLFFPWMVEQNNSLLTTDFKQVEASGPYDIILCYDVIDHLEGETPVEALEKLKKVLAPGGKIHMRCHPSCSRHGCHLYRTINKAFISVVFTPQELKSMGHTPPMPTNKVLFPIKTYRDFIAQAGFNVVKENIDRDPVEPFFQTEIIKNRILDYWTRVVPGGEFPTHQMTQSFLDYVLIAKP